jgi:hypothetical protein
MHSGLSNVGRYLRRLGEGELAAFVRDLYRARGYDARTDDGLVFVADGDRELTVCVVPATRLPTASSPTPNHHVDAVVTAGDGTGRGGTLAAALDARLETAADVGEMLRFAVPDETTRELCLDHLGTPPDEMVPPALRRAQSTAAETVQTTRARTERTRATVGDAVDGPVGRAAGALVVVALAIAVGTSGVSPFAGGQSDAERTAANLTTDEFGSGERPAVNAAPPTQVVPVRSDGTVKVESLAAAHRRALADTSYLLFRTYTGPARDGAAGERIVQRTMVARGDDPYRVEQQTTTCGGSIRMTHLYYDGKDLYGASYNGTYTYQRIPTDPRYLTTPAEAIARHVEYYLTTTNTVVTNPTVEYDGVRVVASGQPTGSGLDDVENYTAEAVVDEDGIVRHMRVEYDVVGGPQNVVFEFRYTELGTTEVRAPGWYTERWGNATAETTDTDRDDSFAEEYSKLRAETMARKLCRDLRTRQPGEE